MNKRRRIARWGLGIAGFFVALLLIGASLGPKLIKLDVVNEFIERRFSDDLGGSLGYQKIDIAWFPRPHAVVQGVAFSLSVGVSGTMTSLQIYPKILPLFWGDFHLARLTAIEPEYSIRLPNRRSGETDSAGTFNLSRTLKDVHDHLLAFPEFTLSNIRMQLRDGSVDIWEADRHHFRFYDIQASYIRPGHKTKFSISCKSNLWHDITIGGWLDAAKFTGRGNIRLAAFQPPGISRYFFPDTALKIEEAQANLVIDFELNGPEWLHVNVEGSVPYLKISSQSRQLELKDNTIKGAFHLDRNETQIAFEKLSVRSPRINLAGKLGFDKIQSRFLLEIEGREFQVDPIRKLALKLGENSRVIREVFNIIRGGHIPQVTVSSHGSGIEELSDLDNIVVHGEMRDGNIYIPEVELNLNRVEGKAVISNGILQGYDLKAKMGDSLGQNGKLKLGLNEMISPFHLDIMVQADLAQLPPVLKRVVRNEDFIRELALVEDVSGNAFGNLVIGIDHKQLQIKVEATEAYLTASYQRIPYPLKIDGGLFFFDGLQFGFSNFDVAIGNSLFSHLSCSLKWQKTTELKLGSETAILDMEQIYPWLASLGRIRDDLRDIKSAKGFIKVETMSLSGPLLSPQQWQIQSHGNFENLILQSRKFPGPLEIIQGQFKCTDTQIRLQHVEAAAGKSTFSQITAEFDWGEASQMALFAGPSKIVLDDLYPQLLATDEIKKRLDILKPLKGTLALKTLTLSAPLAGLLKYQLKLSARMEPSILNSGIFPAPLQINSGEFNWQGTLVELNKFNGAFGKSSFTQLAASLDWSQAATLAAKSESIALAAGEILPWLASLESFGRPLQYITSTAGIVLLQDLEITAPLAHPAQWRFSATGEMQNIMVDAEFLDEPVTVNRGKIILTQRALSGVTHNCVKLGSTHLTWGQSHLIVIGDIYFLAHNLVMDMNISLDHVDWTRVEKIINYATEQQVSRSRPGRASIEAHLKVGAQKFNYEKHIFESFLSDISILPDEINVDIERADLCGVSITGNIQVSDQGLDFYLVPIARGTELESTLACITNEKASASGTFTVNGEITAKAKAEAISRLYSGGLDFSAKKGRIYRLGLLAKVLAILNVTEIYRGEVPDLVGEGFAYNTMTIKAGFKGKKLVMEECIIDGASMGIVCEGDIDLVDDKIDLVILVAPFKTIDRIVKKIPLVSNVLGGKIMSIPFRAKGDLGDPTVIPLSPTVVGSGVLALMERTLKLPITIIQPLLRNEKQNDENRNLKKPNVEKKNQSEGPDNKP